MHQEAPKGARYGKLVSQGGIPPQGEWQAQEPSRNRGGAAEGGGSLQGSSGGRAGACPRGLEPGNRHLPEIPQLRRASW